MQPAYHAARGPRVVVLGELIGQAEFAKVISSVGFHEPAAFVAMDVGLEDDDAVEMSRLDGDFHRGSRPNWAIARSASLSPMLSAAVAAGDGAFST